MEKLIGDSRKYSKLIIKNSYQSLQQIQRQNFSSQQRYKVFDSTKNHSQDRSDVNS